MRKFVKKALTGTLSLAMVLGMTAVAAPEASAAKVKVKKVTVTSPSGKVAYIAKGKKVKLSSQVTVSPNKSANKKVSYKSANSKIASVNSKGVVKGVKAPLVENSSPGIITVPLINFAALSRFAARFAEELA